MIDKEIKQRILSSLILIPVAIFFIFKGTVFFIFFLSLLFLPQVMNGQRCVKQKIS